MAGKSFSRTSSRNLSAPQRSFLEHVAEEIEGNPAFALLDDQLVAYEATRKAVERARSGLGKTVVIVTGGPGSGKSVIATRMLGGLCQRVGT